MANTDTLRTCAEKRSAGATIVSLAAEHEVSISTMRRWLARATKLPPAKPKPKPKRRSGSRKARRSTADLVLGLWRELGESVQAEVTRTIALESAGTHDPPPLQDGESMRDYLARLLPWMHARMLASAATGDDRATNQTMATIDKVSKTIKQLDQMTAQDSDAIVIPRHKLDEHRHRIRTLFATLREQPLTCSDCGVKLRMREAAAD